MCYIDEPGKAGQKKKYNPAEEENKETNKTTQRKNMCGSIVGKKNSGLVKH